MTTQVRSQNLASSIGRIAGVIGLEGFPTGERAALRRMIPEQPPPLTFYRFALRYLPEGWDYTEESRQNWMTIVAGIALMSPNAHHPGQGLGSVLGRTGYSEARLERLLTAEDSVRRVLLLRAARFLAAKTSACNWVEAAQLMLTKDDARRENLHRGIAKDFYRTLEVKS